MKCYTSREIFSDVSKLVILLIQRGVREIVVISNKEDIGKIASLEIEDKVDIILIEAERDFKLCYKF
ncbi:hypothetical protein V6M85_13835 [Sulfolobus tengchongensis]|uniref:Uncharacterized protein n=1 Tax=Sulfolobus tengchongensis TaxID=207809 RepID=A0AAX4L1N6_9CREN